MKRNNWISRLIVGGLLLALASSVGVQAAASMSPSTGEVSSTLGTSPVNSPNGIDLKQTLGDYVVNAGRPVGADEIVSFLADQASSALQDGFFGPTAVFNPAATCCISAAALSDSKFVLAYADMGDDIPYPGTAIVGQIFGTSINWGSEYVFNSGGTGGVSADALSDSKFVVAYQDLGNSDYGTAIVGQVAGTSITWGNEYVFNLAYTRDTTVAALSPSKFVVAYQDGGSSWYGTVIVGQVTDTITINYGSAYPFNPANTEFSSVAALTDSTFVVAYRDPGNSGYGTARVGQVSGASVNWGSVAVFNTGDTEYTSVATLMDSKFVVAYRDNDNSGYGTAIVGHVTGTTINYWGNEYVFSSAGTQLFHSGGVTRLSATSFVVGYENVGDDDGRVIVGTVSGDAIFFGNQVSHNAGLASFDVTVIGLSESKYIVAWDDESNGYHGTAKVGTVPTLGSVAVFNPAGMYDVAAAKLTDSKFVLVYSDWDNSGHGIARVGQVSGTSITWGPETAFNSTWTMYESVAALSATKIVVAYMDDVGGTGYGAAKVGTISGTSIAWGNAYTFNTALTENESVAALSDSKFVVAYRDWGNAGQGTARVGQVSDKTIVWGPVAVFNPADTAFGSVAALSDSRFVVTYTDLGNFYHGTARVGQVTGTSVNYGLEYAFNTATTYDGVVAALSDSKFVVAYQDGGNVGYGTAVVGTVAGTLIGYGSEYVFHSAVTKLVYSGGVTRLSPTTFLVGFENQSDSDGRVVAGTVSGNTITFGHQVSFDAGSASYDATVVGLSPKFVVAWSDESNSYYGMAKVGTISTGGKVYLPLVLNSY